ncbi:type I glutamate--ammonia ligase [Microlunatus flavus]|uniref:Glutamine synthetase n=1 Tax=Microlunatus flavus TaxID=1036181 RepID=A0A1H9LNX9_9ACTN|nr:glutamine synthetase family protein [Microlunatus flavus]SER13058.1 glutamine synthetase [Microlunatus flavus]
MIDSDLEAAGVRTVLGTMVNAGGLVLAKIVPLGRLDAFATSGVGAAPVWDVYTADGAIAFTDSITAVGDRRLRVDPEALALLDGGLAWGPLDLVTQDGSPAPSCPRTTLRRVTDRLAAAGLEARVGHELELVLVQPDGSALETGSWVPYGATGLLDHAALVDDLVSALTRAGVPPEQVHAEYGRQQLELSLPPADPVRAADSVVLARVVIGQVTRRHGVRASFSPTPFPGSVGSGAHQHLSLTRDGVPLLSGGTGPHGLTAEGGSVIGALVAGLPEAQGLLGGSVLSGSRLAPGGWSGAFRCWGTENREAAVRYLEARAGNPHGANVEVKIIDPSACVYLASAVLLALALDGVERGADLPAEVVDDPSTVPEAGRAAAGLEVLPTDLDVVLDALDDSALVRRLLGDAVVDATVAVHRLERRTFAGLAVEDVAARLRLAWSA